MANYLPAIIYGKIQKLIPVLWCAVFIIFFVALEVSFIINILSASPKFPNDAAMAMNTLNTGISMICMCLIFAGCYTFFIPSTNKTYTPKFALLHLVMTVTGILFMLMPSLFLTAAQFRASIDFPDQFTLINSLPNIGGYLLIGSLLPFVVAWIYSGKIERADILPTHKKNCP